MANAKESSTLGMASAAQVARLLMLTPRRLRQLADAGHIPKAAHGKYPLAAAIQPLLFMMWLQRAGECSLST